MVSGITFIYGNVFSPVDSHGHKATSTLQTLKNGSWTVRIVRYQVQIYFKFRGIQSKEKYSFVDANTF